MDRRIGFIQGWKKEYMVNGKIGCGDGGMQLDIWIGSPTSQGEKEEAEDGREGEKKGGGELTCCSSWSLG